MIVGIDPGLLGALFFINPEGTNGEAVDMPVHLLTRGGKGKRELDIHALLHILEGRRIRHAFIELAGPMPRQGTSSTFSFGKTYGVILGLCAACRIPTTLVPPVRWKRGLQVPAAKAGARARASQLMPEASHQWPLVKHDGRAESALIALYGVRQLQASQGMHKADVQLVPSDDPAYQPKVPLNGRKKENRARTGG
jgi:crossover junction endodeoxyribonuclease RuvC